MEAAIMSDKERHLGLGLDYQYDRTKSIEENRLAELEYFKSKGIDVSTDPELEKEVQKLVKEYDSVIDEDLSKLKGGVNKAHEM
jgi:aromatic ring hydroxylase